MKTTTPIAPPLPAHVVALFLKVKASILAHPKLYDQSDGQKACVRKDGCGTPGCILGWAKTHLRMKETQDTPCKVAKRLCVEPALLIPLWDAHQWPHQQYSAWRNAPDGTPEAAQVAAKRIDIWLESNGTI